MNYLGRFTVIKGSSVLFSTLVLSTAIALLVGCNKSSDSGASGATTTGGAAAILAVKSKVTAAAKAPGGAVTLASEAEPSPAFHQFSSLTDWNTTAGTVYPDPRQDGSTGCSYTSISVKTQVAINYSPTAKNCKGSPVSAIGIMNNAISFACVIASLTGTATSAALPASTTITPTGAAVAAAITTCGMSTGSSQVTAGAISSASITVTTPSDTTTYDRQLAFTMSVTGMGSMSMTSLIRFNSTNVNFAAADPSQAQRTLVNYDIAKGLLKAEFIYYSSSYSNYDILRIYYDSTNDVARFVEDKSTYTGSTKDIQILTLSTSKPATSTQTMAFSSDFWASRSGYGWPNTAALADPIIGCVDLTAGTITAATATSHAFSCSGLASVDITGFTQGAAVWTLVNTTNWQIPSSTTPPTLAWDMTTMLTAAP